MHNHLSSIVYRSLLFSIIYMSLTFNAVKKELDMLYLLSYLHSTSCRQFSLLCQESLYITGTKDNLHKSSMLCFNLRWEKRQCHNCSCKLYFYYGISQVELVCVNPFVYISKKINVNNILFTTAQLDCYTPLLIP